MSSTAEDIQRVALKLLEKSGAEAVSMRRVAAAVGVTPMALYHHFKNRRALLDAIVAAEFCELERQLTEKQVSGTQVERLISVLEVYVDYALQHPRVFDYLFTESRAGARRYPDDFRAGLSPTLNRIAELVTTGIARRELKPGDAWEISLSLWAHVHGYVMLYRAGRFDLSEKQFRALIRRSLTALFHGLEK